MKISFYDTDPRRLTDPNYASNCGSFGVVAAGFNKGLKEIGAYAEPDEAEWVGVCDGLNIGFKYKDKKAFVLNVFDCINTLPLYVLEQQKQHNTKILGLSSQVTELWKKHGVDCKTVTPGCDADFWRQTKVKNTKLTFLFNSFANVRSGLDLALNAFDGAFRKVKDVELIVKNTSSDPRLEKTIKDYQFNGNNIKFINERISFKEMRDLYSISHYSLNVMKHSSWGLNIHEAMACNCVPIVGNFCPSNEIVDAEHAHFLNPIGEESIFEVCHYAENLGLLNCYQGLKFNEEPNYYAYNLEEYIDLLRGIYINKVQKPKDMREFVIEKWQWKDAAKRLVEALRD